MLRRVLAAAVFCLAFAAAPARAALDEGPWVNFVADTQTYAITDIAITIEADQETPGAADVVRWGTAQGVYPNVVQIGNTCCSPGSNEIKEALIPVAALPPGGRVFYRLEYLGAVREGSFFAPPAPGEGFRLGVIGDNRSNPGRHQSIVNAFKNHYGDAANYPPLFVNTGDMVASGEDEADWDTFFQIEADGGPLSLLGNMVFQPTFGNHEEGEILVPTLFDRNFPNPRHFAYKYGNVLFVNINSEDPLAAAGLAQTAYANANADPDIEFKVAIFHQPAVTTGDSHDPNTFMVGTFMDVFEGGNVDIVLQGHNHQYERSLVNGIHYIVTGAGGVGVGDFLNPNEADRTSFSLVRASQDNFVEID
ncbi:MAG: metallophosphoesterase, partial [Candidatus Methylomirabilis sp.]|nr:metallophosphoesterase [Deltaproteobacteria bacterium]